MSDTTLHATATIDATGALAVSGFSGAVPWWSFAKIAIAIAALRSVETGALMLDGELPGEKFSLRQLLRHEAGLPDYGGIAHYQKDVAAGKPPWPVGHLLKIVEADRLRYQPGKGWGYSNIGYLKIRQILERQSGRDLAEVLAGTVFGPAGLASTRLAASTADIADVHMAGAGGYHPGWVYHGLVVGTAADAARLLWLLTTGRLLQPATYAQMLTPRALPEYRTADHPDPAYGLGIMLRAENPADHPLGHNGEGPGSKTAVWAKGGRAVAVWTPDPSDIDAERRAVELLR